MIITMTNFRLFFLVFTLSILSVQSRILRGDYDDLFNVVDYGATGDGHTDDTQAFREAWEATCKSSASSPTMHVPAGKTFLLHPLSFSGPCKSNNVTVLIDGDIKAPSDPSAWKCHDRNCEVWIAFLHLDGLIIHGSGTINGQGRKWWDHSCHHKHCVHGKKPTGFVIAHSNNVHIDRLKFLDSPQMHIALEKSTWVYVTNLNIKAPGNSPNTDGIHIQGSTNVFIHHTVIATGDDCISIGDGSSHLNISKITCGPGHGISIGSLGKNGDHETVENIRVSDVDFVGSSNGVRIKTWQGGSGYARNIIFERIRSHHSKNPIIIDQYYCDHQQCTDHASAVHISNVTYRHIYGTSSSDNAVKFACSESVPCTDIFVEDINMESAEDGSQTSAYCLNAKGRQHGEAVPNVPCLSQG